MTYALSIAVFALGMALIKTHRQLTRYRKSWRFMAESNARLTAECQSLHDLISHQQSEEVSK